MLSGTAFYRPTGQTHAITKDCWAGAGVITLLRVIAAGGWDDASLARWLLVAAFGRTVPLAFLKGVTLYLVMGDGGSLHERSDWGDQVDGVIHNLDQLFGVGALAPRGLPPFIGGLCGDHSPHRTTMTQTKLCPIFQFGSWWAHPQQRCQN